MVTRHDIRLPDGRTLRAYDTGSAGAPVLLWHHGSPQTGVILPPLLAAAEARGIRLVSYARPSYGGSSPSPGRTVASAASDVAGLADALGIDRFVTMGASGGGPHALACGALLPERTVGVACLASIAPYTGTPEWFAGMAAPGALRAALDGRAARAAYAEAFDPASFTAADWTTLESTWASLGQDAQRAGADGPDGLIDDDVAFATGWGFDLAEVRVPVLLVQGGQDRVVPPAHAELLARELPQGYRWDRAADGHISVLEACPAAMDWLLARYDGESCGGAGRRRG